jgi:lipopolysaccharide transport system ATP-binding protein
MDFPMSFESTTAPVVIELQGVGKHYPMALQPMHRLWQALWNRQPQADASANFSALQPCDLVIRKGEVVGIVGKNGAGKSTLLQLVTATIQPSVGSVHVHGKVSAILELGSGFNVEFSGRENIVLSLAMTGTDASTQSGLMDEIIEFSGIGPFIDQPIKTYSSGMQVRLAFAIATCSCPDVLIVDEALSVGDGEFARKSFDRILALKSQGTTILFCSHSLFHIEAMCSRAIWLDKGRVVKDGHPSLVIPSYQDFLDAASVPAPAAQESPPASTQATELPTTPSKSGPLGFARLRSLDVVVRSPDGQERPYKIGAQVQMQSMTDSLLVRGFFESDPDMPAPSFAVTVHSMEGRIIGSSGAWIDQVVLKRSASGSGWVEVQFPNLALLKGAYTLSAFLFCERGIHIYDNADHFVRLQVSQVGIEQGVFHLPRTWASFVEDPSLTKP